MQYLKYPMKIMNITQNYNGSYSHIGAVTGVPTSYPIDDNGASSATVDVYAPCDVIVRRIYGVGNSGTNTIWLESISEVKLANNTSKFVTILFIHPNDDVLKNIKVGQKFKQGEKMFKTGSDGNSTGNHIEIQIANVKFAQLKNNGWVKNSKGSWVISDNAIKPEKGFFVDSSFTQVKNSKGLSFEKLLVSKVYFKVPNYSGNSIADALKTINEKNDLSYRTLIAKKNNINNYTGSASQNIQMLKLLKNGKLIKP